MARTLLLIALMLLSNLSWAQDHEDIPEADKAAAREMFRKGDEAYRKGEFEEAVRLFVGADTIMNVPTTGLEAARSLVALGRLVEARKYLKRVARGRSDGYESTPFEEARVHAARLLRQVDEKIGRLTLVVEGPRARDLTAHLSEQEIRPEEIGTEVLVDPGDHALRIVAKGFEEHVQPLTVKEGEARTVTVEMIALEGPVSEPDEPVVEESADLSWWPYVAFGVGGAALIAGGVTGGLSLSAASDFQQQCDEATRTCPAGAEADADEARTLAHVSTVMLIVGGVGVAAGTVGLVLNLTADEETALRVSPTSVMLSGRF